ncbi:MAG: sulfite exporter TauE/SafE family protein [Pseudolabrys sp.]
MIDLPAFSTFLATLESERFLLAVGVALLAGIVRGFSGFGSALIYVPLVSALYEPKIATVSCALMDYICVLPYALRAFRHANWREVLPAFAAALLTVPLGTHVQSAVDPTVLRWGMSIFVLGFVVLLASGWRYPFKPNTPAAMGAGALSGFAGGATQMGGPPIILYWLGAPESATVIRANLLAFLMLLGITLIINYALRGLMIAQPIALGVLLWPAYIVALAIGAYWFKGASTSQYRRVAYVIVALAALVSLPVIDKILP